MNQLSANELKVRGISAIESVLAEQPEAVISVRGKERFVVMEMTHYHYLRECELEAALLQSQADLHSGRAVQETAAQHMARLEAMAQSESAAKDL
jgi:Lon protease-like protein